MKRYMKLFLLLFTFTTLYGVDLAAEPVDNTSVEIKVKQSGADSEEKEKDLQPDLLMPLCGVCISLPMMRSALTDSATLQSTALHSAFKPPRA